MSGIWLRTVGVSALFVVMVTVLIGTPAAADEVFLELRPSTIQAGHQLELRANCGDTVNPATVHSRAFGEEVVLSPPQHQPQEADRHHRQVLLTGTVTVPGSTSPGEYAVELRCADGGRASATLFVLDMARPTRGPDTGGGGTATTGTSATGQRDERSADAGVAGWLAVIAGAGGAAAFGLGTLGLLSLRRPRAARRP